MAITAKEIQEIRNETGLGVMDIKNAMEEAGGDREKAMEILKKSVGDKMEKRSGRATSQGKIGSYLHGDGKSAVMVEVNCETDFVGNTDSFKALCHEIAMHIAATNPKYLSREEVSVEDLNREKEIYRAQLQAEGKPAEMVEKILEGKMSKYYSEYCLLEQAFIKDETTTIEKLLQAKTGEIGEKVSVRRFARFELGEGIEKVTKDFAEEVAEQLK